MSGESPAPRAGRVCAAASSVTGRVTQGAAPPFAPAPAPALSFPPGSSGEGSQGSPGRRRQGPAARRPASAPGPAGRSPSSSPSGRSQSNSPVPAGLREARASEGGNTP